MEDGIFLDTTFQIEFSYTYASIIMRVAWCSTGNADSKNDKGLYAVHCSLLPKQGIFVDLFVCVCQ